MPDHDEMMEALIDAEVERQLAPYAAVIRRPMLKEMGRLLRLALREDPKAQALLRVMVSAEVKRSDKVDVRGLRGEDAPARAADEPRSVPGPTSSSRRGRR